jgi:nucleoside-diphosphate-sugar epimerase
MLKLIFGCGYLGERVARQWKAAGHEVAIVTRSQESAHRFQGDGYTAIVADVAQPKSLRQMPSAETVLFAVGFDHDCGQTIDEVYAGGIRNALGAVSADVRRFIYISTTGVYGPASGEWVDETTPPDPRRDGGRASLAAEQALAAHPLRARGIILRLAGIYGPGRIPFVDKLRNGEPIPASVSGYLNLIHVDDAAEVVVAADRYEPIQNGPRIYCVSDGEPVQRGEYYSEVARQIGAGPPRFAEPEPNSPRAARAESNRRISNERMLAELRVTLAYPDYRSGLAAILQK